MARTTCLVGAVVLMGLSVVCIAATVVEMARGAYGMGSARFWEALVFHPVAGLCGLLLLHAVRSRRPGSAAGGGQDVAAAQEGPR
jgi:hypothetical protein